MKQLVFATILSVSSVTAAAIDFATYDPRPMDITFMELSKQTEMVQITLDWVAANVNLDHIEIGYSNDPDQRDRNTSVILSKPADIQAVFAKLPGGRYYIDIDFIEAGKIYWRCLYVLDIPAGNAAGNDTVTLQWQIPTQRENGEPLASKDIAGFEIYHTANVDSSNPLEQIIDVTSGSQSSLTLNDLPVGDHHFAIATIDNNGVRSAMSQVVSNVISDVVSSLPSLAGNTTGGSSTGDSTGSDSTAGGSSDGSYADSSNPSDTGADSVDNGEDTAQVFAINLQWAIPTARVNGDALAVADIDHYEVYHYSNNGQNVLKVQGGSQNSLKLEGLTAGSHQFAIAAVDMNGLKSELSSAVAAQF